MSRLTTLVIGVFVVAVVALVARAWHESRLPATYSVMQFGTPDYGGGSGADHIAHGALGDGPAGAKGVRSVAELRGPRAGEPDFRATLAARRSTVHLPSGRRIDA